MQIFSTRNMFYSLPKSCPSSDENYSTNEYVKTCQRYRLSSKSGTTYQPLKKSIESSKKNSRHRMKIRNFNLMNKVHLRWWVISFSLLFFDRQCSYDHYCCLKAMRMQIWFAWQILLQCTLMLLTLNAIVDLIRLKAHQWSWYCWTITVSLHLINFISMQSIIIIP